MHYECTHVTDEVTPAPAHATVAEARAARYSPEPRLRAGLVCAAVAVAAWVRFLRDEDGGLFFGLFTLGLVGLGAAVSRRWALGAALGLTAAGLVIAGLLPGGTDENFPRIDLVRATLFLAFPVLVPTAAGMMLRRVFSVPPRAA